MAAVRGNPVPAPQGLLEILDHAGRVRLRVPLSMGVTRIGRAYDNDVIVDDPFVCPHHLEVTAEGGRVTLRDLDSVNGTWRTGRRRRIRTLELGGDDTVQFGHSLLRFRSARSRVAPTRRDASAAGVLAEFNRPWMLWCSAGLAAVALSLDEFLDLTRDAGPEVIASRLVFPVLGLMMWVGLWAMLNRLISQRANFGAHLAIACTAVFALLVIAHGVPLLAFALGLDAAVPAVRLAGQILCVGLSLYAHMRYLGQGRAGVQAAGAGVLAVLLIGGPALGDWLQRERFNSLPQLDPLLKPPALRLVDGETVEDFLDRAESLRQRLAEESDER